MIVSKFRNSFNFVLCEFPNFVKLKMILKKKKVHFSHFFWNTNMYEIKNVMSFFREWNSRSFVCEKISHSEFSKGKKNYLTNVFTHFDWLISFLYFFFEEEENSSFAYMLIYFHIYTQQWMAHACYVQYGRRRNVTQREREKIERWKKKMKFAACDELRNFYFLRKKTRNYAFAIGSLAYCLHIFQGALNLKRIQKFYYALLSFNYISTLIPPPSSTSSSSKNSSRMLSSYTRKWRWNDRHTSRRQTK